MSSRVRRIGFLMRNVEFVGDCWIWTAEVRGGYAYHAGRQAYRVLYELLAGPIPEGMELDHLCRKPVCVFPDHLEPVTREENQRRAWESRTHCRAGHRYTPENTYMKPGTKKRACRACQRAASSRYRARKISEVQP